MNIYDQAIQQAEKVYQEELIKAIDNPLAIDRIDALQLALKGVLIRYNVRLASISDYLPRETAKNLFTFKAPEND